MQICPVDREWIHTYILEPYLQGAALLNRAWKGVDFYSLTKAPLSLKERMINWITGTALMTPFLNTIIWLAWQTFGTPEKLFDPYAPEVGSLPTTPRAQVVASYAPPQGTLALSETPLVAPADNERLGEIFVFNETSSESEAETITWRVDHYSTFISVQQQSSKHSFSSSSTYNPNWTIKDFHYQSPNIIFDVVQKENHLLATVNHNGKVETEYLKLKENIPWIQQSTLGFKNFILSSQEQMEFYGVLPENPSVGKYLPFTSKGPVLVKAIAKKVGEEEVAPFGRLIKVEVQSAWGWPYNLAKGELWFDPQTGVLRKFIEPGLLGFISQKSGQFIPNP